MSLVRVCHPCSCRICCPAESHFGGMSGGQSGDKDKKKRGLPLEYVRKEDPLCAVFGWFKKTMIKTMYVRKQGV